MRRWLVAVAVALAVLTQPSTTAVRAGTAAPGVSMVRAHDPETLAPGIQITYRWESRFDARYSAAVRLYEDGHLVGRIPFMRGWQKAPAFFRTSATSSRHTFRAVGVLLRRDGTVVVGSRERSVRKHWTVTVQPGQVVR